MYTKLYRIVLFALNCLELCTVAAIYLLVLWKAVFDYLGILIEHILLY